MPGKIFSMFGIFLQYTLVILLYYFLYKIAKMITLDLKTPLQPAHDNPHHSFQEYKPERVRLAVLEGGELGAKVSSYNIEDTLTIGRNDHNDIVINDGYTSHEHACITKIKKGYWLYDLNSTNGTFLNGRRVKQEELLKEGDLIRIGTVTFKFER